MGDAKITTVFCFDDGFSKELAETKTVKAILCKWYGKRALLRQSCAASPVGEVYALCASHLTMFPKYYLLMIAIIQSCTKNFQLRQSFTHVCIFQFKPPYGKIP